MNGYQLTLFTIPDITSFPEIATDPTKGQIFLTNPEQNYFKIGQKFFLTPTVSGQGEDPTIARTVVSVSSSMAGGVSETQIIFTPPPVASWTCSARCAVLERVAGAPFVGYITKATTSTPSASQISQCIVVCDEREPPTLT